MAEAQVGPWAAWFEESFQGEADTNAEALAGIAYLNRRCPLPLAEEIIDANFREGVREMVLQRLGQGLASAATSAEIREIAKEIQAVRDPAWTP